MNELNLERCHCIPKEVPGADWRCLEQLVAQDPAREMYKVQLHPEVHMLCTAVATYGLLTLTAEGCCEHASTCTSLSMLC